MKTLENFLKKHKACEGGFEFAKDLTLEQFLETCKRGDWILWLFARTNPNSLRELTLAKAYCAATVEHLMKGERSLNALYVAIKFGEGRATKEGLAAAADAGWTSANASDAADAAATTWATWAARAAAAAAWDATWAASYTARAAAEAAWDATWAASYTARAAAEAAWSAAEAAAEAAAAAVANELETADICRKYLPLKIWDQSQF